MKLKQETVPEFISVLTNHFNPWWIGGNPPSTPGFRRRDFVYLNERINDNKALTLLGPRQVGKTTLIRQIIKELLENKKINTKRILYVTLDDIRLSLLCPEEYLMSDILEVYQSHILLETFEKIKEPVYLIFDEVQKIPNWAEHLKSLHATSPHIHILATGSASFSLTQKSKETGPGRQLPYVMFPLKFIDAMALYEFYYPSDLPVQKICETGYKLRDEFIKSITNKSMKDFYDSCNKALLEIAPFEAGIQAGLVRYFSRGGYPEIVIEKQASKCQELLQGYVSDMILKDLAPWYEVRDISKVQKLLFMLASLTGEKLNISEINKRLHGSELTIEKYVEFFEQVYVLGLLPPYTRSKLPSPKQPKLYFYDIGFRNGIISVLDVPFSSDEQGHVAETIVYDHLRRLSFKLNASSPGHVMYFQGKKGEVDFVVDLPRYSLEIPVEVKFRRSIDPRDFKGLREFQEEKKPPFSIIITTNKLDLIENDFYIPLWLFLLIC